MNINGLDKRNETGAERVCLLVRFRVRGNMRYLSHAETMRMFQRALVRAGVRVAYSQGFNPHQRMSLVLPRSVGVESDDEMLCLRLDEECDAFDAEALNSELPDGIEIISAEVSQSKNVPSPDSVRYIVTTKEDCAIKNNDIEGLLASEKIVVDRPFGSAQDRPFGSAQDRPFGSAQDRRSGEGSRVKAVDVRPFLESITAEKAGIVVDCKVSPAGTIRVDEILDLLKLTTGDLAGPVRRVSVRYS